MRSPGDRRDITSHWHVHLFLRRELNMVMRGISRDVKLAAIRLYYTQILTVSVDIKPEHLSEIPRIQTFQWRKMVG